MIWLVFGFIGIVALAWAGGSMWEAHQGNIVQRDVESMEREQFIKQYRKDFGEDTAAEFWDQYH
jgi:hypothetical protein